MARDKQPVSREAFVGDTLENLIRQFSQELCFYRELIQNAIDAGSPRVDVECVYEAAQGLAVARVIDYGEGMDRRVIDTQLTRLFSSSKEDDFTKIGKFGIGFVSVFAVKPEAVVVDTGKAGEHWRVLFKPDCSFERIALDTPVDGTRVEVYMKMSQGKFRDLFERSRETVSYWCRHAEAEVFFDGEPVNEPFAIAGPVQARRDDHGTVVVAAISRDEEPFFGFYNQGITLLEGKASHFAGVAFKIKSRYLEHTLSRDNVKQDPQYQKAMGIVADVVRKELLTAFIEALSQAPDAASVSALYAEGRRMFEPLWEDHAADAAFLPQHGGPRLSLRELREAARSTARQLKAIGCEARFEGGAEIAGKRLRADGRSVLLAAPTPSSLTAVLIREGFTVLAISSQNRLAEALATHGLPVIPVTFLAAPTAVPTEALDAALPRLGTDTLALLASCGIDVTSCGYARFDDEGAPISTWPFLLQARPGPLMVAQRAAALEEDGLPATPIWTVRALRMLKRSDDRHLVLNVGHPLVQRLVRLHPVDPRTAAFLLAKLICLSDGLHPEMNVRLLERALEVTNAPE